ncbi:phage portal protein, partial [Pseudomonas otitidis]|nr:phage portal protein [Pseudomonas otitidis]
AFYSAMTQNGIYTRDDCRAKEDLPPMGGNAGVLTVQSNMLPIDMLGQDTSSQKARDVLSAWLNNDYQPGRTE